MIPDIKNIPLKKSFFFQVYQQEINFERVYGRGLEENNIWNTSCKGHWEMLFIKEFWKGYGISIKEPTHDLSTVNSFIYSISYISPFPIFKLPDKNNNKNRQV